MVIAIVGDWPIAVGLACSLVAYLFRMDLVATLSQELLVKSLSGASDKNENSLVDGYRHKHAQDGWVDGSRRKQGNRAMHLRSLKGSSATPSCNCQQIPGAANIGRTLRTGNREQTQNIAPRVRAEIEQQRTENIEPRRIEGRE